MKWLKILISTLIAIFLIVIIAIILLITVVDPNRFKPYIIDHVKNTTGRELIITGNLSWFFFPTVGIKMGHAELQNSDHVKLIEAENIAIGVDAASLFHFHLQGNGQIDTLHFSSIRLNALQFKFHMQHGIVDISPLTAKFYQGTLTGNAKLNLTTSAPTLDIQAKVIDFQMESLLADVAPQTALKIIGTGNATMQFQSIGLKKDSLIKNGTGSTQLAIRNGAVVGLDIGFLMDSALALLNKQTLPPVNTQKTPFETINATAFIQNGVITNKDLILHSPRLEAKGNGTINIMTDQIQYDIHTSLKSSSDQIKDLSIPIPISITGSLHHPFIKIETDALIQFIANEKLKKAKTHLEKQFEKYKDKLPPNAGRFLQKFFGE